MSDWMLTCSVCGREFRHSSIPENLSLAESYLPAKPEFPPIGLVLSQTRLLLFKQIVNFLDQLNEFPRVFLGGCLFVEFSPTFPRFVLH